MNDTHKQSHFISFTKTSLIKWIAICIVCTSLLSGCTTPALQTVEVTRIVPQTIEVTRVVEVVVTVTAIPPGSGRLATTTPSAFVVWDPQQVLDAILAAGLEAGNPRPMITDDYGLVPMLAIDGIRFFLPSICSDCGGRIMSFADQEKLQVVRDYYGQMGRFSAILFSWVFVKGNILVQINGRLSEADARKYEAILIGLK
jgi:hypothetical protein